MLVVLGGCLLAGLLAGALWAALATSKFVAHDNDLRSYFGRDVWFVIVTAVVGLLAGTLAWVRQRDDGLAALAGLVLGGLLGASVAWKLGGYLGPGWRDLGHPPPPDRAGLALRATGALMLWPIASVLAYFVLLAGWPRHGPAVSPAGRSEPFAPA